MGDAGFSIGGDRIDVIVVDGDASNRAPDQDTTSTGRWLPVGVDTLVRSELHSDPPRPEELTNAIGVITDHLDDMIRELPDVINLATHLVGPYAEAIAAVEAGGVPALPFMLSREAAEDVFRTLATESAADRRRNPGLDPALVGSIVAACCVVVAIMRRLQLDEMVIAAPGTPA